MSLNNLIKLRTTLRRTFSRGCTEIEQMITEECTLEVAGMIPLFNFAQLKDKADRLFKLDESITNKMLESDDVDEDALNNEIEQLDAYRNRWISIKTKCEGMQGNIMPIIKDYGANENPLPDHDSDSQEDVGVFHNFHLQLLKSLGLSSEKAKVLKETSLDGIVSYIKDHPNLKIITMVGAGISTAAGIPDFRSPGIGIYDNLQKYNLPYPNAFFEPRYFSNNPKPFYQLARELLTGSFKPTKAHYFIKLLQDKNLLLRHYSQNIDILDRLSGISEDKLIEAHGTFYTSHCTNRKCREPYSLEWLRENINEKFIPTCSKCNHCVKPDIVFFGENLPEKFYDNLSDFQSCDLLIIMGSSLAVEPFASLVMRVRPDVPRLMINATSAGENLGLKFETPDNGRDVLWKGDCDYGCELLAEKLGWKEDLIKLIAESETVPNAPTGSETKGAAKSKAAEKKL